MEVILSSRIEFEASGLERNNVISLFHNVVFLNKAT